MFYLINILVTNQKTWVYMIIAAKCIEYPAFLWAGELNFRYFTK